MIRIGLLPALALAIAAPLAAQQINPAVTATQPSGSRGLIHYGKWASAALAATLIGLGAREYATSDDSYRQLFDICRADITRCTLGSSGTYLDPASEQLYQASLHSERQARVRLIAGQASLLLAAGLFLADRGSHENGPGNIPYHVTVEQRGGGTQVGMRFTF